MTIHAIDLRLLAEELDALRERLETEPLVEEAQAALDVDPLDSVERERYDALVALDDQLRGLTKYAANEPTAVPIDEFEEYAEELAGDLGCIPADAKWPCNHIDWKAAAEELRVDYREITFDGTTYLVRST